MDTHILHRHCHADLPRAVGGEGPWVIDHTGKRYLDASGGAAVSCLGHNHPVIIEAIKAQISQLAYAHTGFFTTDAAEQLASQLAASAPGDLEYCYFVSGGSEATEASLKLARQYFLERGEPQRRHIIARRQSYHGNTLGALGASGNQWRRAQFEPLLVETHYVSPCYAYRDQRFDETEEAYGERLADELDRKVNELGPENVMIFVCEPVVGATAGAVPPVPGYLRRIREVCDRYGILLMFDEVMCGMGRTGTRFACEQDGVAPDLLTIAKGLGAGYQPIGAVLLSQRIFDALANGSGFFQHGHTYMAHPTACAASLAVQNVIDEQDLLHNVRVQGAALMSALTERFGNHPYVGDIRGRGLFLGLELVEDRTTKAPFDPARGINKRVKAEGMQRGLMCYPMGGTIDGRQGDHVLLAPPFIIEAEHVEMIVERLGESVDAAIAA